MPSTGKLDIQRLRRELSGQIVGRRIYGHLSIDSTMNDAHRLAKKGEPEGSVVLAEEQTAGRGRFARKWISSTGQNLHISLILRPKVHQLPYVNMAASLAVSAAVDSMTGLQSSIKWPNDVRLKGRKLAGILIESELIGTQSGYTILGIGLNINLDPTQHPEIEDIATSIYRETGNITDRNTALRLVLKAFDDLYHRVKEGESLTRKWAYKLDTLGQNVEVRWVGGTVSGHAESVDSSGNLVLRVADGSRFTATAGEVTLQI